MTYESRVIRIEDEARQISLGKSLRFLLTHAVDQQAHLDALSTAYSQREKLLKSKPSSADSLRFEMDSIADFYSYWGAKCNKWRGRAERFVGSTLLVGIFDLDKIEVASGTIGYINFHVGEIALLQDDNSSTLLEFAYPMADPDHYSHQRSSLNPVDFKVQAVGTDDEYLLEHIGR